MRQTRIPSEEQQTKIRKRWAAMHRRGVAFFIASRGILLLLWMCICYVGFSCLFGTQRLLHQAFVIESTLPCLMLLSAMLPVGQYLMVRGMMKRIGPANS